MISLFHPYRFQKPLIVAHRDQGSVNSHSAVSSTAMDVRSRRLLGSDACLLPPNLT
jgi:hypothetical protein